MIKRFWNWLRRKDDTIKLELPPPPKSRSGVRGNWVMVPTPNVVDPEGNYHHFNRRLRRRAQREMRSTGRREGRKQRRTIKRILGLIKRGKLPVD